jgi:hypothetical protein
MFKTIIISLFLFFASGFTTLGFTSSEKSNNQVICYTSPLYSDEWVLEFFGDKWWWVYYDVDGNRILEIPADF